jgi:lysophospholipase L1-like esterase
MYHAMGGKGSMITWRNKGLAGSDYVHFTRKGATKVGKLLYEWLKWEQQPASNNQSP